MKKIIKGKVYDTETAKKVASWYSSYARNDFHYYEEELYQKKTGEFFLYGEGNAASPYSEKCIDGYGSGERIEPLTYTEAQEWAEKRLDGDEYCEIFGEPSEDEDDVHIHCTITAAQNAKLRRIAGSQNASVQDIIRQLIEKA